MNDNIIAHRKEHPMEQLENMEKINSLQMELGYYLVSIMPVPWSKICFYARAARGFSSIYYGFIEKETGVISAMDFFWNRYDSYPVKKRDAVKQLNKLVADIYNAYLEQFGEEKIWRLMFYTIESDGKVRINLEYKNLSGNSLEQHDEVYRRLFGTEYEYYWTKYPSTEIGQE